MAEKSNVPKPTKKNSGPADCGGMKPQKLLTPKDVKKSSAPKKK